MTSMIVQGYQAASIFLYEQVYQSKYVNFFLKHLPQQDPFKIFPYVTTFKNYGLRPLIFLGQIQKHAEQAQTPYLSQWHGIKKIAGDAKIVRLWVSCLNVFLLLNINMHRFLVPHVRGKEVIRGEKRDFNNLFQLRKNYSPSGVRGIFEQWTHAARTGLYFGETVQFVQQYLKVPGWLEKTTPWISNSALAYLGCQGVAQEWAVRGLKPKNKQLGENLHSWIIVALYISYIFQGTLGMLQLRFGESFSKNRLFAKCQLVALCAVNILPIAKDISEWLYTRESANGLEISS